MITRQQAVAAQIDGAIRAFEGDDHVCAVTLAAAAETATPVGDKPSLFDLMKQAGLGYAEGETPEKRERELTKFLNKERDWLKNYSIDKPEDFDVGNSLMYIIRAMSKYYACYGYETRTATMWEFGRHARDAGDDHLDWYNRG